MRSKISKLKRELTDDSTSVQSNHSPAKKRKVDEPFKSEERLQSSLPLKKRFTSNLEKENKSTSEIRSPAKRKSYDKILKNVNHTESEDDDDIDEIFFALKKGGIKADRSKHKSPKSSPSTKVPELEKSPDSLIINHKRTPKKKIIDDFATSPRCSPRKPVESPKKIIKEYETTPIRKSTKKTPKTSESKDIIELCTPRSTRRSINIDVSLHSPLSTKTSRRSSRLKTSETPEKKLSNKKLSSKKKEKYEPVTPSTRRIIAEQPRTPLEKARQSLHVSTIPEALPCREKEFKNVLMFLENKIQDGIGGCMYISGVPGTGKTATVTQVIRHLQDLAKEGTIPEFKYLEINGMRLADPRQAYVQICQQLFGNKDKLAPDKAHQKLDAWFSKSDRKNNKISTVLLVDELDLICTKKQEVIYNILDWPTRIHSRLIVLTIANTMDMPERLFKGRVTSRLGLTRLTFMPYTHKQLEEIVVARLTGLNAFSHDAVQLVTRKVAAVSGDARRALDICRRATELPDPDDTVTIKHIDKAIREMTNSNIARVIRSCSEMEKLFLKSMSDVSVHSGLEEVDFLKVIDQFFAACALEGIKKPPVSSVITLSNRLKCFRLIYTNQSSGGILQKLTLNVTRDDIYYALNDKVNSSEL